MRAQKDVTLLKGAFWNHRLRVAIVMKNMEFYVVCARKRKKKKGEATHGLRVSVWEIHFYAESAPQHPATLKQLSSVNERLSTEYSFVVSLVLYTQHISMTSAAILLVANCSSNDGWSPCTVWYAVC